MIAKIAIFIICAIVICDVYLAWNWRLIIKNHIKHTWERPLTLALLIIASGVAIYDTVKQAQEPDYFPDDFASLFTYIGMLVVFVIPLVLITLCGIIGSFFKKKLAGYTVGFWLSAVCIVAYLYGKGAGFKQIEVKHVELTFDELPPAFDGYRIVQFSDAHVGTMFDGREELLQRAVDSINAQKADLIVFTGDLVNKRPSELEPHIKLLSTLEARDGVYSILGNHDYPMYLADNNPAVEYEHLEYMGYLQQKMGWHLLRNYSVVLRRGNDSIILAGLENEGMGRMPQKSDIRHALWGVNRDQFVIMLEHDPTAWRRKILKDCHAQLTLSGHTHGGQLSLFGLSPAALAYQEYEGLYTIGSRQLYVTKGLGGVVPFRLGASGEIVVITLHKTKV